MDRPLNVGEPSPEWVPAPKHPREAERLRSLRAHGLADLGAIAALDRVTKLAARLLGTRIVSVTLLDEDLQLYRSNQSPLAGVSPRDISFCGWTILQDEPMIVSDLRRDERFAGNPYVNAAPNLLFYAGVAIRDDDGLPLGTLCALDTETRRMGPLDREVLITFGGVVEDAIRLLGAERRVRREVELREAATAERDRLVAMMPGAMYRYEMEPDGTERMAYVSEGIRDVLGYSPEEFRRAVDAGTFLPRHELARFFRSIENSARTFKPWHWEGRMIAKGGGERWVQGDSKPERAADGAISWTGILTDITALKRFEADILATNSQLEVRVEERTRELEAAHGEMLMRLGRAAEVRDDDTGAHIARVSRYCEILASGIGLPNDETALIVRAAPMHDLGKISVPDAILLKPGRLDPEELATMREHAEQGARMLSGGSNDLVRMAETIARTHHERWDGAGYPRGLKGEEIPLCGRIVAIADVFDALTSERPYKRAWSPEDAAAEIEANAGKQFDPNLVEIFLKRRAVFFAVARDMADTDRMVRRAA